MSSKKNNFWYWLGQTALGLVSIAVTFSPQILEVFPDHTVVNQFAIPIGLGMKFIWDSWKYRRNTLPESQTKLLDIIPNGITGVKGSIKKMKYLK